MAQEITNSVLVRPLQGVDKALAYRLPETIADSVKAGSLVRVPLGRRAVLGIVTKLGETDGLPLSRLKYVHTLEQPFPVLTADLLLLAEWVSAYYAVDLEVVLETMIPAAVRKGMRSKERVLIRVGRKLDDSELSKLERKAPKQAKLYVYLASQPLDKPLPRNLILKRLGIAATSCQAMVKQGIIKEKIERIDREAYADDLADAERVAQEAFDLTAEQEAALSDISGSIESGEFAVHLLHGVTGSGKTEVYLRSILKVVEQGGGAIFLVPEVALTPQTVSRLRAALQALGLKAVVWHSHLSGGERFDAWRSLATGEARVVVGARSAIFAPVRNLKFIVVDEEHEPAYKQEEKPRYHGRDVAVYRAHVCRAVCVLGSATPALESLYNVEQGKYRLNRLTRRVDNRQLPHIYITDRRLEALKSKGATLFTPTLAEKLRERFENREQSILFLNRRGYHTSLLCPDCGYVATCDHCSVTLTHHRTLHVLRCHLCGFEEREPQRCPKCRSQKILWRGSGTQRVEDAARKLLPGASIIRLDTDSMQRKNRFREILNEFRSGKIDVLVGTQMIAKGLDFPNVTLVGLVDADVSLHLPDFRSAERTFQLLVQVAGRAGRGDRAGEVVVQTYVPHAAPIQYARQQDFDGFLEDELERRREYHYPPFRHLIHHHFRGKNADKLAFYAEQFARQVEALNLEEVEIRGPAPAPVEKIKDNYRFQVWYFVRGVTRVVPELLRLRHNFKMDPEIIDVLDVDAVHLV